LIDLTAATGAYDLIMLDDPWFPRFASERVLTDLTPLYQKHGLAGPDKDFVASSIALCKHPYENGERTRCLMSELKLFFTARTCSKHGLKPPATRTMC
jgi:hypothetical protein